MPSNVTKGLKVLTTKKIFYWIFLLLSLFALSLFVLLFKSWIAGQDFDPSDELFMWILIPATLTVILLCMSVLALFNLRDGMSVPIGAFILMTVLSIPIILVGAGMLWLFFR
jgi:hypothetical protein